MVTRRLKYLSLELCQRFRLYSVHRESRASWEVKLDGSSKQFDAHHVMSSRWQDCVHGYTELLLASGELYTGCFRQADDTCLSENYK